MNPAEDEQLSELRRTVEQLSRRQAELEARIRQLEGGRAVPPPIPPQLVFRPAPPPPLQMPPAQAPQPMVATPPPQPFEARVGLNWVNRIAVFTLLLGAAFLFKYGVDNNWIGPGSRVVLGVVAGIGALLSGEVLARRNQRIFAQGITGLGLALLYLSFYAAASLYQVMEIGVAFGLMTATTALAGWLSLKYESQTIALLGLFGGYVTPIALSTGEDHPWVLFSYIFLLNSGALAIPRFRPWKALEPVAFASTVLLYGAWLTTSRPVPVATTFALAFYVQFAMGRMRSIWYLAQMLTPWAIAFIWERPEQFLPFEFLIAAGGFLVGEYRKWREAPAWTLLWYWLPACAAIAGSGHLDERDAIAGWITLGFLLILLWVSGWMIFGRRTAHPAEIGALGTNPAVYFSLMYYLLNPNHHEWMGLLAIALGALYLGLAYWMGLSEPQGLCATGVALAFVALAMPIQFTSFSVSIAWALEALAIAWVKKEFRENQLALPASAILFTLASLRLFAVDIWMYTNASQYRAFWNARFLAFLVCVIALWLTAWWFKSAVPYVAGHVLMLSALALEATGIVIRNWEPVDQLSVLTVTLSILMAAYAVALVTGGVIVRAAIHRILGLILAGMVIVKLYFLDVWVLGRGFRIVAFLGLGALLLALSYLYSRFRESLYRLWKNETP